MSNIKRIILTHVHSDHTQAANEVKKRTSAAAANDGRPKIYAHWIDSG
jgi:glyoxylase-like metal-dependent hydrolase (beta-lactamase superfamily II)